MSEPSRRRRRRRATAPQGTVPPAAAPPVPTTPAPPPAQPDEPAKPRKRRASGHESRQDRALRDLVGAGHSQLSPSEALRARDVNRPTAEDMTIAEGDVAIVRREWKPNAD